MNFLDRLEDKNFAFQNVKVNFLYSYQNKNKKYMGAKIKETKQKIVAVIIILFMFMMVAGSLEIKQFVLAANTDTTNMFQNIVAGTLDMEAVTSAAFNNITAGVSDNSMANLSLMNVRDFRGTGAGWQVTATSSNFVNGASGTAIIPNSRLKVICGDLFGYNGASTTGVAQCTSYAGNFGDGARAIVNAAATAGEGAYNLYNNTLNLLIAATDDAQSYNAVLSFTIVSL